MSSHEAAPHKETHFKATQTLRDIVIGMSDGLTVPFALAAGLSGASVSNNIIVTAGLAEIAAGSIAMGLGGYLAARTDVEHYLSELKRELVETREKPLHEEKEVSDIFKRYGLSDDQIAPVLAHFRKNPKQWVDFMMRFELGLDRPDTRRGRNSALTIALSYVVGGLIPLSPYMMMSGAEECLWLSIFLTLAALFVFGYVKGHFTSKKPLLTAFQTASIGAAAAGAAFLIARIFS